jgi:hypothetical protein
MNDLTASSIDRNLSPHDLFVALGHQHRPKHGFRKGIDDPASWQAETIPAVLATLGRIPEAVDPNPELIAEFQDDKMITQRWFVEVQEGISAILVINRPVADSAMQRPAIFCWAGHSAFGKEPVMGNRSSAALRAYVRTSGLEYGRYMAEVGGFVTFGIDWMGIGDRNDSNKPNDRDMTMRERGDPEDGFRHWCDILYLHATLLGYTPLGMNLAQGRNVIDFVSTLDFIDEECIGVMGESTGGTLALWSTLFDERLKATEIICYSDTFPDFALRDHQYCGSQITPGLFDLVDVADLQGLIAPRPLMTDLGAYDPVFRLESAVKCSQKVQEIYAAAGAEEHFRRQIFTSGHGWKALESVEFFDQYLR